MISFIKLGEYGRFGNQLFQYAFLRTQAKRLGVKFYCPPWAGENIFLLNDIDEKSDIFKAEHIYKESPYQHGFDPVATEIQDDTDIAGYFQSWKFFKKEDVMNWYTFNEGLFTSVREKYESIDWNSAVAVHVRLGDYLEGSLMFYTPTPKYFKEALAKLNCTGDIIVFSEDVEMVKNYLGVMPEKTIYVEGNKDYEDFYLMTLCKDTVISPSSFSWWAAYLNKHKDKRVVMPKYWYIPSSRVSNFDLAVDGWSQIAGHRMILDAYYYRYICSVFKKLFR